MVWLEKLLACTDKIGDNGGGGGLGSDGTGRSVGDGSGGIDSVGGSQVISSFTISIPPFHYRHRPRGRLAGDPFVYY